MVGRFVEDQIVGIVDEKMCKRGFGALAAGKRAQWTFPVLRLKSECLEHDAQRLAFESGFGSGNACQRRVDQFLQRGLRFIGNALREVSQFCVTRADDSAAEWSVNTCQQPKKRGLTCPVWSDQSDALSLG